MLVHGAVVSYVGTRTCHTPARCQAHAPNNVTAPDRSGYVAGVSTMYRTVRA